MGVCGHSCDPRKLGRAVTLVSFDIKDPEDQNI